MMASPTPPSGSLGGITDDRGDHAADQGHAAAEEESSGNVGMSLRPPGPGQGLMYADLQGGRHNQIVSNSNQIQWDWLSACTSAHRSLHSNTHRQNSF